METKLYNQNLFSWMILLMTITACSQNDVSKLDSNGLNNPELYENIQVSVSALPLFADFGEPATKTDGNDQSNIVSLESLIDRTQTASKTFNQYRITEIPFISNVTPPRAILSKNPEVTDESCTEISLFLVETTDTVLNVTDRKVVTMIPDEDYMIRYSGYMPSYINKGVFSGVILYSDLDGCFRDVYVFGGDFTPIINAEVIDLEDISSYMHTQCIFVVGSPTTKCSEDGGCLYPSICVAFRQINIVDDENIPPYGQTDPGLGGGNTGGGNTGGGNTGGGSSNGGSNPDIQSPIIDGPLEPETEVPEEVQKYNVYLYNTEGGTTIGSGSYQPRTLIFCNAIPNNSYIFDRWTGDFNGKDDSVTMLIQSNISATAYFRHLLESGSARPCYDMERKIYNPLKDMNIAPTNSTKTNYIGSTFGWTRNNGSKRHKGLDLYAPEGTPVYAMYDGKISTNTPFVTTQPNRDSKEWPAGYSGDKENAGNRFSIECIVDGNVINFVHWHMMAGTPMAVNPRTGTTFKPGDEVFAGEIVGYTGRTGNAYDVDYPHLHLGILSGSEYLNPEFFINGSVQWSDDSRTNLPDTEINNIRCDEENNAENQYDI